MADSAAAEEISMNPHAAEAAATHVIAANTSAAEGQNRWEGSLLI